MKIALALAGLGLAAATTAAEPALFPANGATGVSPDTPLRLTLAAPAALGTTGFIRIHDATDNSVVETIDLAKPTATQTIGGLPNYNYYPVIVAGAQVTIYPKHGTLAYNRSYYVTIDAGVTLPPDAWRFRTRASGPAPGTARLTVAADGTGDFCTLQGAIDFIPPGNTNPTTITLRRGTYTEIVCLLEKHAITITGEDRKACIVEYANNERFNNNAGGNPFGAAVPNPSQATAAGGGAIYRRGMFLAHRANGLVLSNLTLRNTTPQGGSQAEALILNGTTSARAILRDVDLYSFQDTLQINGQAFVSNCYVEGDVDFLWGTGPCFFENCTFHSLRSGAYFTQVRNPPTNHGYVFVRCVFDGAPGVTGNFLSRIQLSRFPASEVVLIDCTLGPAVAAVGWQFQATAGAVGETDRVHFWEHNSRTSQGEPVDVSQRLAGSKQLVEPADAATIANYRDPAFVLDWKP